MKRHVDKHLIGGIAVCAVITTTLAFSAVLLRQPTPPAEAAMKTVTLPIVADGDLHAWTGSTGEKSHYVNVDEAKGCSDTDYNYRMTPYAPGTNPDAATDSYIVNLSALPNPVTNKDKNGNDASVTLPVIKAITITPCLGVVVPKTAPTKTVNPVVEVLYKMTNDTASYVSPIKQYTLSNLTSAFQTKATWTANESVQTNTSLQVFFRMKSGNLGAKLGAVRVAVSYDLVTTPLPPAPVVLQTSSFGPASTMVKHGAKNVAFLDYRLFATKPLQINTVKFEIHKSAGGTLCVLKGSKGTNYIKNIRIVNTATNAVVMGPTELSIELAKKSIDSNVITLHDSFTIKDHTTTTLRLMADVSSVQDAVDELFSTNVFNACSYQIDVKAFGVSDVRSLETSTDLPVNQIAPNLNYNGKPMTIN